MDAHPEINSAVIERKRIARGIRGTACTILSSWWWDLYANYRNLRG
jgi:hypothetical protein